MLNKQTTVTVLITTMNKSTTLQGALESLLDQTLLPNEIVLIDDSEYSTIDENIFAKIPNTIILKHATNGCRKGANFSRNYGVAISTGELILFLDDDDEFYSNKIETIVKEFQEGIFDVVYHPADINYIDYGYRYKSAPYKDINIENLLITNCVGATSMVGVRKAFCAGKNIFDEHLPALQDWDAWIGLVLRGARFRYIDAELTKYRVQIGLKSTSKSVDQHDFALGILNKKYSKELSSLSAFSCSKRMRHLVVLRALKLQLSKRKFTASSNLLKEGFRRFDINMVCMAVVSALGVRVLVICRVISAWSRN